MKYAPKYAKQLSGMQTVCDCLYESSSTPSSTYEISIQILYGFNK